MIMKYKKIVLAIALSAGMYFGTSALASGIPTVDAAAIAQMVLTQMQQMYSNMVQQYNTAVNTLQNFTGTRGLGLVDYNLNLRSLIPTSARSRLNGIMNGTSSLSSLGRDIFNRLKLGDACSNLDGEVKQNCLKAREFEAEQQAVLEEAANTANQRLQNIESLMSRINTATDAKSIADLSARIQAEQVALQSSQLAAQFQQTQMNKQNELVRQQAEREAHQKMFPRMTQADIQRAIRPPKN